MLEAIGAKRCSDVTTPDAPGVNYQEAVSALLSEEADNDAATQEGDDGINLVDKDPDSSVDPEFVLPAVDKVSASKLFYPFQPWLTVL